MMLTGDNPNDTFEDAVECTLIEGGIGYEHNI